MMTTGAVGPDAEDETLPCDEEDTTTTAEEDGAADEEAGREEDARMELEDVPPMDDDEVPAGALVAAVDEDCPPVLTEDVAADDVAAVEVAADDVTVLLGWPPVLEVATCEDVVVMTPLEDPPCWLLLGLAWELASAEEESPTTPEEDVSWLPPSSWPAGPLHAARNTAIAKPVQSPRFRMMKPPMLRLSWGCGSWVDGSWD
jgi:hypothetical protein